MEGWGSASVASGVCHPSPLCLHLQQRYGHCCASGVCLQAQPPPHLIEDHGPNDDACGSRLRGEWSLPSYHPGDGGPRQLPGSELPARAAMSHVPSGCRRRTTSCLPGTGPSTPSMVNTLLFVAQAQSPLPWISMSENETDKATGEPVALVSSPHARSATLSSEALRGLLETDAEESGPCHTI